MTADDLFQPRLVRGEDAPGPSVLIVDDVDANLVALEAALGSLPCRLVYARSGSEALGHLLREDFALILMDVQMPAMDGYETARLVRARRKTEHIPIIFLTAHDYDSSGIKRAYDLGAVDFLPKPLDVDVLRAKAQAFIALHERTLEVAELRAERAMREERARQEGEALKRDMERLTESDRRTTALLAALARELKAPLAPVRSAVEHARGASLDTETSARLRLADAQLAAAERIVGDLEDVTKVSSGGLALAIECVDLAIVVDIATVEAREVLDAAGVRLAIDAPPDAIAVEVDVSQMARVIANLLEHAARETPSSGTITLSWRREYGHAFVRVTDTGRGLRADRLSGMFELSVPAAGDDASSHSLGLGLALAKQLVELHRGRITVSSRGEGHGTTFEIKLLAAEFPLAAVRNRLTSAQQRAVARPRVLRVLVVDNDDDDTSRPIATLLTGRGHHVLVAHDAKMALALLVEHRPDVAFVALELPTLDGFDLFSLALTIDPPLSTRFVAMGPACEEAKARQAGFTRYVAKPLASSDIVVALEVE